MSYDYKPMYLPCGGRAIFDEGSGIGYRCEDCMAMLGSIGQPRSCKEKEDQYRAWEKLGGKGWDYQEGRPK